MAGLLDDIFGEGTVKDDSGMTQADRRMPIWSGLIKAGLLGVAGGGNLMPEDRARYYAQAGGALADIPMDMMKMRSDAAQQALRQQQVQAGKVKLAQQAKMAEYAKSPEYAAAMKDAPPAVRFAAQAALDSGDVDAFQRVISSMGGAEHKQRLLDIKEAELKLKEQKASGTYKGTGIEAQHLNNLQTAPPDSFEYWSAYNYFSTPRVLTDGTKIDKQNLQGLPPPTYRDPRAGVPGAPGAAPQTPDEIGLSLQPGESRTLDGGVEVYRDQSGTVYVDYPSGGGKEGRRTVQAPNAPKQEMAPTKPDPTAQRKLTELQASQDQVKSDAEVFLKEWRNASTADRVKTLAGVTTPLSSAWTRVALRVKEAGVFNLGVITGPDLILLQRVIADPSSMKSLGVTPEEVEAMVNQVLKAQELGIKRHEKNLYYPPKPGQTPPTGGGGASEKVRTWNPATGRLE